ncbi:hypothetical protein H8R23_09170 [Flavobacterium sp. F-380]|uniref:DUF3592 domain-containing protein n=1 Tax=Flavobacterium kayseriense TaxID=2764714 RepID=A0ABR7J7Z0_9FLAO|nr:hypothetical protein [Flavobacterium kayseriense]MBC5841577.1 hypothetical protein [Flavobacterium kayseriense]MBC5848105.1 hypothetical protein [Flavobacterium kayseriense]
MKEKYSRITFKLLLLIPPLFILFVADQFILPQKQINDRIKEYKKIVVNKRGKFSTRSSQELIGYRYHTHKGYEFATAKTYIEENEIIISESYLFQSISSVKTMTKDYSKELMSGSNGACFYIAIGLFACSIISLLNLKFNTTLSENGFQNIILSNVFLLIIFLYLLLFYS